MTLTSRHQHYWHWQWHSDWPPLAGNDAEAIIVIGRDEFSCLPPLVVTGIGDMENVTILEGQAMTGQATVFGWVIVK